MGSSFRIHWYASKPGHVKNPAESHKIWGDDAAEAIIEEVEAADPRKKRAHVMAVPFLKGGYGLEHNHQYHPYFTY